LSRAAARQIAVASACRAARFDVRIDPLLVLESARAKQVQPRVGATEVATSTDQMARHRDMRRSPLARLQPA
jgi:hypothetical protein